MLTLTSSPSPFAGASARSRVVAHRDSLPQHPGYSYIYMDWEPLVHTFAEYIPFYGTLYSFKRMSYSDKKSDHKSHWINAVNQERGVARSLVLYFERSEPIEVVIVHALAESDAAKAFDLLTGSVLIYTGYQLQGKPNISDHTNVLVTGASRKYCDDVIDKLNGSHADPTSDFLGILNFHNTVYMGKFLFRPHSANENIFMVFPFGMRNGAACYIFTTFTNGDGGSQNTPLASISPRIVLDKRRNLFLVRSDGTTPERYWFRGVIRERGRMIMLTMLYRDRELATMELTAQTESIL